MPSKDAVNVDSALNRPDGGVYADALRRIQDDATCPFCPEHLAQYHTNPILAEGENWLFTDNMYPYKNAAHHLLAIHKQHIEHISELSSEAWEELRQMCITLLGQKAVRGATFVMRFGETAYNGASVNHLHAQVVSGTGEPNADPVMARVG